MDPIPGHLESRIQSRLRDRGVYGLALCAFDSDHIRFAGGVGYADVERGVPVTPATVFRVGSISKLLATALVLRLVDAGDLDLDRPFNDYLPGDLRIRDQAGDPARSPLRTLLSHSSGLPFGVRGIDVGNPAMSYLSNGGRVHDLASAISGLRLSYEPGERIVYSNPAFNVAGCVAATVSGRRFEDLVREQVLGPLAMTDSEFTPHRTGPGVARHYGAVVPPGVGPRPADHLRLVATPMGGLTTNVLDLARFGQMVLREGRAEGRDVLRRETVATATSVEAKNRPELDQGFGLGFKVRSWRGRTVVGHDGNMPGVAAQLLVSPEDGVGAVALTNGYALAIPHEVVAMTLDHLLDSPAEVAPDAASVPVDRQAWESLGRRVQGTYRVCDASPPGPLGRVNDRMVRIRIRHEVGGRLRVDGNPGSDGAVWLEPDAVVGRYRSAAPVDDGTTAVIEERADGTHLWLGYTTHLHRRRVRHRT